MIFLELPAIKALYTQQIYCLPSLVSPPVALTSNTPSSNVNNETSKVPYSSFKKSIVEKQYFLVLYLLSISSLSYLLIVSYKIRLYLFIFFIIKKIIQAFMLFSSYYMCNLDY